MLKTYYGSTSLSETARMTHTWSFYGAFILSLLITCAGELAHDTNGSNALMPTLARLSDHLMDGYRKGMRPVHDWRRPTVVYLDIIIYAILGVDEKNQLLRTYIWLRQSWLDEFLHWDPEEFDNITQISIPAQMIWIPDLMVLEFVESTRAPETPYVYVTYKGKVNNNKPLIISTACTLNIYYFPFDIQKCTVSFTSWLHKIHDVNVSLMDIKHDLSDFKSNYMTDGEWNLMNVVPRYRLLHDHEITFGEIEYTVVISRRPLFYTINLILPSLFLMIMDVIGFYLPPESGERISFKITLLLGYSVFLIIVKDTLPATGTPLIGVYFIMCMAFLVISLIESITIVRMVHQQNVHPQIPGWVRSLILEKMAFLLCIKAVEFPTSCNNTYEKSLQMENGSTDTVSDCIKEDSKDNKESAEVALPVTEKFKLLTSILKEIVSIKDQVKNITDQSITKEWLQVGYILDMFLFRAYLFVVIVYAISLLMAWSKRFKI